MSRAFAQGDVLSLRGHRHGACASSGYLPIKPPPKVTVIAEGGTWRARPEDIRAGIEGRRRMAIPRRFGAAAREELYLRIGAKLRSNAAKGCTSLARAAPSAIPPIACRGSRRATRAASTGVASREHARSGCPLGAV